MAKIPYSRVVNVSVSRTDRFPTRRGFGTQLILTHTAAAGQVDATYRTKLYATIEEVAADYNSATSEYKAALSAFSQNPRPLRIKIGYIATPVGANDAAKKADFIASLGLIENYDQAWYMATVVQPMRDQPYLDGLVEWISTKNKIAMIDSNDANTAIAANLTSLAGRKKGTTDRTAVFYHPTSSVYLASAAAAYMSTRVLDDADSAYTMKFKQFAGIPDASLTVAQLTAVTGFTEGIGQSESNGHCANTYIDIGDQDFLCEGSMLKQNVFLDEIHSTDWIIARTEEEMLALFLNNPRIPFTDQGMQQLASVPRAIMAQGVRSGIVAKDIDPNTGLYAPAFTITVPSVFDISESQRKARIAPAISVRFRYSSAVHYSTINYTMTF